MKKLARRKNLILRTPQAGHVFIDEFKWEAYAKF